VEGVRRYYSPSTGEAVTGWLQYGDAYYYLSPEKGKLTGVQYGLENLLQEETSADTVYRFDAENGALYLGFQWDENGRYYVQSDGTQATGAVEIDGVWYCFGEDGIQETGLVTVGESLYYFDPDTGERVTGLATLAGKTYYFTPESGLQSGWQTEKGKTYYFDPDTGEALTGLQILDSVQYYFKEDGSLLKNGSIVLEGVTYRADKTGALTADKTLITGTSLATVEQMQAYIKSVNPNVAQSVLDMIPYYLSEGEAEGIRGDIAFAQSCLETGNFTFQGSAVTLSQNNFCGMGVTSNGVKGCSFATPQLGIRAQIQHLKAYATTDTLNQECIDTRFKYVQRGCAPYVEWLGIPDNPYGKGWAATKGYGERVLRVLAAILKMGK
jgi:glucan-binding repeat-containing protein